MLVLAMIVASCWGVVQLAVLASPARTLRLSTLLLAVAVGFYGCGMLAVIVELVLTRAWAAALDRPLFEVVRVAAYTTDPFVEEVVKVLPLVLAGLWVRTRRQWGLSDYTVAGAGLGAGFGLFEAVLRYGGEADRAVAVDGGWLLPLSLAPPFIPTPVSSITSWLPAPALGDLFALGGDAGTNQHLVWSALAGFGIGVLARLRTRWRLLGIVPVLLVGADHASSNYEIVAVDRTPAADLVSAVLRSAEPALGVWPLLVLAVAVGLDVYRSKQARSAHPNVLLAGESSAIADEWVAIGRYLILRLPWPGLVVSRFTLVRRAALNAARWGDGKRESSTDLLLAEVVATREQLDAARSSQAWQGVGLVRAVTAAVRASGQPRRSAGGGATSTLRRHWPVGVWLLLLIPPLVYYGAGTTPLLSGVQDALASVWVLPVLLLFLMVGLLWTGWRLAAAARGLQAAARHPASETIVRTAGQMLTGAGALLLGLVVAVAAVRGTAPDDPVIRTLHALDAVSDLLLVAGIALVLAGLVFFPPFAAVAVVGGGVVLVPSLSAGLAATASLGIGAILLSQAAGDASATGRGGGGGRAASSGRGTDPVPNIPQQPPRPQPQVQNWKLRNIVDNLWHKSTRPDRVGDGTTMDAIRNEIRTGQPTQGAFHAEKGRTELRALTRWLVKYEKTASKPDVKFAREIKDELKALLEGAP